MVFVLAALGPAAASPVRLVLQFAGSGERDAAVEATVTLEPAGGRSAAGTGKTEAFHFTSPVPGSRTLDLPEASLWRVGAVAEGFWVEQKMLAASRGGESEVVLSLYPTGWIRGTLQTPPGVDRPDRLAIRFQPSPAASPEDPLVSLKPEGEVTCTVGEGGVLACELPAGGLDLWLYRPGFAAEYRWGIRLQPGQHTELGPIALQPGASVAGFVKIEGEPKDVQAVWVELRPEVTAPPAAGATRRLRAMAHSVAPDPRGWFQFRDVPPGTYRLLAGAEGYATVALAPIRVLAGRESAPREALFLRRPARLEVVVVPPADPGGRPWRLTLSPREVASGSLPESRAGSTAADGSWSQEGLTPGRYTLFVGGARNTRWFEEEVDVESGQPPLEIRLPLIRVKGTVTLAGEPIRVLMIFGGERGERRVPVYSNFEGEFAGVLPREGTWPLNVVFRRDGPTQPLDPVEVIRAPGEDFAELTVEIPDTVVSGEVVDEAGRPVTRAEVRAARLDGVRAAVQLGEAETDEEGRFELRGMAPGRYRLSARRLNSAHPLGVDGTSAASEVSLRQGRPVRDVRLTIEGQRFLRGRVLAHGHPVPGALVSAHARLRDPFRSARIDERVTGPSGEFEVSIPAAAVGVDFVVRPPGLAVRLARFVPGTAPTVDIVVEDLGGELVVEAPATHAGERTAEPILFHGQAWVPLSSLGSREGGTDANGRIRWRVQAVEPGGYTVCPTIFPDSRCTSGYLPPDGELTLVLAAADEAEP